MDEVICKFLNRLCQEYNKLYNANLKPSQIDSWYLDKFIGQEGKEIFKQQGFFINLEPYENAIEIVKLLNKEYKIIIASKPQNSVTATEKLFWIKKYMPYINFNQITLTSHKHLLKADMMIDDCGYYLELFKENCGGVTVCFDKPYNKKYNFDYRIYRNNWLELYALIKGFEKLK
jgi:5'(3')-deoxyribonucleotidase